MAPLVLLHLAMIIYATQGGVDAAEILARTRGSFLWGAVYGVFVIAVSIHAAIGVRVILFEWFGVRGSALNLLSWLTGAVLFVLGSRAVFAVVW